MLFKFKEKPIVLELFAPVGELITYFPIVKSKEFYPSWFQALPKPSEAHTVRNCPGLQDLLSATLTIPAWGDFNVTINPSGKANVETPVNFYNLQPTSQHFVHKEVPGTWQGLTNIKFHNPWYIKCSDSIDWILADPTWHRTDPLQFSTVTGATEFKIQNFCHINTLWKVTQQPYTVKIKAGDAMAHLVPLTERKIELKFEVMTEEIYKRRFQPWQFTFEYPYQKVRAMLRKKK